MPIILETPYTPASPEYNKIHLDHLTITIEKTDYARTQIQARVRPYIQDPITGVKTFSSAATEIVIDDAEAWATELAMAGDMRGAEAANYIKLIVSLLVETKTTFGSTSVS